MVEAADRVSFEGWYPAARPRVLAALIVVTGDLDRADDATDEAMVRAFARWSSVGAMQSPIGWTVRVAINVARRRARRAQIEARLLRRVVHRTQLPAVAGEAWLAVKDLPARQREVLVLRYVADLAELDIAESLGISRSAVSSALTDGRRSLAALFADPTEPSEAPHV